MKNKFIDSVDFVARHYRKGAFRPRSYFFGSRMGGLARRWGVAASIAGAALVASACFYTFVLRDASPAVPAPAPADVETAAPVTAETRVLRIEFVDAPLADVVAEIENVYGVEVGGIPAGKDYRLTLSYEGTATDLVETINELLGTSLTVKFK